MEGQQIFQAASGNPFAGAKAADLEVVEPQSEGNDYGDQIDGGDLPEGKEGQQGESETQEPVVNKGSESEAPIVEKPQETQAASQVETPAPAPTSPEISINDAISKFGRTDLLKALGLDDYAIGVLDYYESKGSIDDYVAIKAINFKDMAPVDLMKYKVRRDNPELSNEAVEFLARRDMEQKYGISENLDEDQRKVPMEVFSHDMEKVRKELVQEQAKFAAPERQPEPQVDIEAERQQVLADPVIKAVVDSKSIAIGPKESPLNLQVVPDKILPLLFDDNALDMALQIKDSSGKPTGKKDPAKAMKFAAFIADPDAYDNALIAHGKTLGKKQVVAADENLPENTGEHGTPVPEEKTLWDAFRNRARATGGR
jgi:hypothetical protein